MSGSNDMLLNLVKELGVTFKAMSTHNSYVVATDVYDKLLRERQAKLGEDVLAGLKVTVNSFLPPGTVLEMGGKPVAIIPGDEFKMDPFCRQLFSSLAPASNPLARVVYGPDPDLGERHLANNTTGPVYDNTGWSRSTPNETPPQPE